MFLKIKQFLSWNVSLGLLVMLGVSAFILPKVSLACVSPPPEGPPPIISWCRPTPWGGCLPSPVNLEEDATFFLVVGGYSTGGASSGDSCEAAISPQFGSIKELKSVRIVDANTNKLIDGFKFSSVPTNKAMFSKLGTARHRWLEYSSPISKDIPSGLPVNLVFEVSVAKGTTFKKDVLSTVIGTTKVNSDKRPEHLSMTFACRQGSRCQRRLEKALSVNKKY